MCWGDRQRVQKLQEFIQNQTDEIGRLKAALIEVKLAYLATPVGEDVVKNMLDVVEEALKYERS